MYNTNFNMSILKEQEYYHEVFLELDKSHKHEMDQIFNIEILIFILYMGCLEMWPYAG